MGVTPTAGFDGALPGADADGEPDPALPEGFARTSAAGSTAVAPGAAPTGTTVSALPDGVGGVWTSSAFLCCFWPESGNHGAVELPPIRATASVTA